MTTSDESLKALADKCVAENAFVWGQHYFIAGYRSRDEEIILINAAAWKREIHITHLIDKIQVLLEGHAKVKEANLNAIHEFVKLAEEFSKTDEAKT